MTREACVSQRPRQHCREQPRDRTISKAPPGHEARLEYIKLNYFLLMTILDSKLSFPLALFGVTCCLAAASPAKALTITSIDQGWYSDSQPHSTSNRNYIAGSVPSQNLRNFFVFSLPNYPISFASFAVPTYIVSADNQTFSLYGFGGNISDLVSGTSSYSALWQGQSFDSLIYNISDSNGAKTFTFNPSGISYLNTLLGAQVAITGDNPSGGYVFGFSNDDLLRAPRKISAFQCLCGHEKAANRAA